MIQRIQTLFFLLAAGGFISMFYLPFAASDQPAQAGMLTDQLYSVEDHLVLGGLCLFGAILALVAIFLFKNRPMQIKLGNVLIILSILIVLTAVLLFINDPGQMAVSEQVGIAMPIVTIILAVLANRFVKKDHKLVKSMDRLR